MATLNYIHDLPHRNTAFIRVGWWVIFEISKARDKNIDWKTRYSELKYSNEIYTIATMFDKYEHVEIQESLNGYIWDKPQIESGYIYIHFAVDEDDQPIIEPPIDSSIFINPLALIVM